MNLIPIELLSEIANAQINIFDSFARDNQVTFYKRAEKEVAVFDPSYNHSFPDTADTTNTAQYQSFTCRIWYLDRQEYSNIVEGGEDVGIKGEFLYNRVRLQCKEDAFNYLKDTERFIIFDEIYRIEESWQRVGIAGQFKLYEIVLARVN